MKTLPVLLLIGLLVTCLGSSAVAANTRKGKKTWNKLCRSCHIRDGEGGRLSPSVKTISQWKRFIDKNHHKAYPDILGEMSQQERDNLLRFLQDYASDADGVQTCG